MKPVRIRLFNLTGESMIIHNADF